MKISKKWIAIVLVAVVLLIFGKYNEAQAAKEPKAIEVVKVIKPLSYVEQFDKKQFNEISGVYKPVRNYLKKNLNDPSSLEIDKTWNLGMNKDSSFAIKTTYRAKNEYNALVMYAIYCNVDMDGNVTDVKVD